ncbi:MAG TPA: hypothetical protein VGK24_00090 [Candidatus Angelobacter sp.]|jgi:hypothetical protein
MHCPQNHERYATQAKAEAALARLVADARRTGKGGKSWKRLNVFPCGNHFHIGRANKLPAHYRPPAPEDKGPSAADLRRKARRDAKAAARQVRFIKITYDLCGTPDELSENVRIAHRMVEQLFSGK